MLTSNDYTELAARCTELASESSEPIVAEALRALASDYLARAAKLHQQIRTTPQLFAAIRRHHGSEEQMFGADEQVRHGGQND
jgi:hypothetical protein